MTMKHISKIIEDKKLGDNGNLEKKERPTPVIKKPKVHRIKARKMVHPMQWFFDSEKVENARREKLEKAEGTTTKKKKNKGGRPTVIDEVVVGKLEYAFSLDSTVEEACTFAGIHRDTLYSYLKKKPEFSDRIDQLRELPMMLARQTIARSLMNDADIALKYAKNKRNNEFNERKDVKLAGSVKLLPKLDAEEADKIKKTFMTFFGAVDAISEDKDDDDDDE